MDISGEWYNELQSYMVLIVNGKNISGTYYSKVGDAFGEYDLVGQLDIEGEEIASIGWVVVWNNQYGSSDAVTVWSGQVQVNEGVEVIVTTWLLTAQTEEKNDWHSTFVGKDKFTRLKPNSDDVTSNLREGLKSSSPKV